MSTLSLMEAQVAARTRMYFNSAREAYERARARAYGMPDLPAYPGDGSTACLTNCACQWRIEEVLDAQGEVAGWDCYWELGPVKTEHCEDCVGRSQTWNPLYITTGEAAAVGGLDLVLGLIEGGG